MLFTKNKFYFIKLPQSNGYLDRIVDTEGLVL